jgi:AraC-like DNA-binding protein
MGEIAEKVGYSSAASFGRRFKLEMGQTPGRYRSRAA